MVIKIEKDGKVLYAHSAWADDETGANLSLIEYEDALCIGSYMDSQESESMDPGRYNWIYIDNQEESDPDIIELDEESSDEIEEIIADLTGDVQNVSENIEGTQSTSDIGLGNVNELFGTNKGTSGWSASGGLLLTEISESIYDETENEINHLIVTCSETGINYLMFDVTALRKKLAAASQGDSYTLSCDIRMSQLFEISEVSICDSDGTNAQICFDAIDNIAIDEEEQDTTDTWVKHTSTAEVIMIDEENAVEESGQVLLFDLSGMPVGASINIANLKIEAGAMATPWRESLEEINEKAEAAQKLADAAYNKVVAAEGRIDNISGDLSTYKEYVGEKFTGLEGNFTAISGELANYKIYVGEKFTGLEGNFTMISGELANYKEYVGEKFTGLEADFETLETNALTAEKANLLYAALGDFTAVSGRVGTLEGNFSSFVSGEFGDLSAGVADIKTLLFGSAAGTTITTEFANSVVSHIGTSQIESGMIKELAFDKITGFDVNTTNVTVHSNDGKSQWADNTIQISDANRVRVQIGKDATGDYSMYVWDATGKLMFDALGLTAGGIQREIIRNDVVAADAAIDGSKINIQTLMQEIDGSTYTFTANHLTYDGQKLDLFLGTMSETVEDQGSLLSSQGTQITTIQGQIASKVWQQDINAATGELSTKYRALEQSLNGFKPEVGNTYVTQSDFTKQIYPLKLTQLEQLRLSYKAESISFLSITGQTCHLHIFRHRYR